MFLRTLLNFRQISQDVYSKIILINILYKLFSFDLNSFPTIYIIFIIYIIFHLLIYLYFFQVRQYLKLFERK